MVYRSGRDDIPRGNGNYVVYDLLYSAAAEIVHSLVVHDIQLFGTFIAEHTGRRKHRGNAQY